MGEDLGQDLEAGQYIVEADDNAGFVALLERQQAEAQSPTISGEDLWRKNTLLLNRKHIRMHDRPMRLARIHNRYLNSPFRTFKKKGKWTAYSTEIEAALSMWLYSINEEDQKTHLALENQLNEHPDVKGEVRFCGKEQSEKQSLRLLGPFTEALEQDLPVVDAN